MMNDKDKAVQVLREMRKLFETPGSWTQGCGARDSLGQRTRVHADDAKCWCILGASILLEDGAGADRLALSMLRAVLAARISPSLVHVNDHRATARWQILRWIDRAISHATGEPLPPLSSYPVGEP